MEAVTHPSSENSIANLQLEKPSRSLGQEALERLFRNKASIAGMVIIAFFLVLVIFAPQIAPHNPLEFHSGQDFLPPAWVESYAGKSGSPEFLLGTDTLGRDVLSRVIYGARVSMLVGFLPTFIILIVGTTIGMVAGFFGGRIDNYLMRLTDIMYGFPDLLFFIIAIVSLRDTWLGELMNGLALLFIALAVINWVGVARIVRGKVLSLKEEEFIEAARCIGASNSRIMLKHLLPNALGPIIVVAAFTIPNMIITEAVLGYLGLGLRPATDLTSFFVTSWGALLLEGQTAINAQPFMLLAPAFSVALVVLAFTFLGDGLRDAMDPRLRGRQ